MFSNFIFIFCRPDRLTMRRRHACSRDFACGNVKTSAKILAMLNFATTIFFRHPSPQVNSPPPHETCLQTVDIARNFQFRPLHQNGVTRYRGWTIRVISTKAKCFLHVPLPSAVSWEKCRVAWTCHMGFQVSCIKGVLLCLFCFKFWCAVFTCISNYVAFRTH